MALDSEAKRWSMLQVANGPGYSHVINPSGSNFDSQVERFTLLNIYGGSLAADVTAPVLSSATGTSTGTTTGTGTVDTDEGNGTLYFYASTSSSETAADIKSSGDSQSVTVSGTQNVTFTGLTAGTSYYAHYVQDDAESNESNVVSSTPAFETAGKGGGFVWGWYDYEQARRDKGREQRAQDKLDAQAIKEKLHRELALAERALEAEAARKAELARLNRLVAKNQGFIKSFGSDRLDFVMAEALEKQTFSKMERLERELGNLREEEMFLMQATIILVNQ